MRPYELKFGRLQRLLCLIQGTFTRVKEVPIMSVFEKISPVARPQDGTVKISSVGKIFWTEEI